MRMAQWQTLWYRAATLLQLVAPPLVSAVPVSFVREVAPILVDQCLECHRSGKSKGAYRLDTFELLLKPGDSEARPITAGNPEQSELLRLIVSKDEDERMPKKGDALSQDQQSAIRKWIAEGARFDGKNSRAPLVELIPEKPRPRAPDKYPRPLPVTALAVNGDGSLLATSGYHEVLLWDGREGKPKGRVGGMTEKVHALCWVGSTHLLAAAGGAPARSGEVWLLDAGKRLPVKRLLAATDSVLALACSPDGSRLAAAGADNRLRMFAMPEGKRLWDIEPHADWITALAFSPDGKILASASRDRTARLFDAVTGTIEATHTGHDTAVTSIQFSRDGKEVFSGDAGGQIRRWGLDGEEKKDSTIRVSRAEVTALGFSDEQLVAATAGGLVVTLDPKTRKVVGTLFRHGDRVNAMELLLASPDSCIVTGSHDGEARIFDFRSKKQILKFIASPGFESR